MFDTWACSLADRALYPEEDPLRLGARNFPPQEYSQDACIPHLVSAQATRAPDGIALRHGQASLTYKELDQRANQLARLLQSLGVGSDVVVARSEEHTSELQSPM